jgi:hypothetical protein
MKAKERPEDAVQVPIRDLMRMRLELARSA